MIIDNNLFITALTLLKILTCIIYILDTTSILSQRERLSYHSFPKDSSSIVDLLLHDLLLSYTDI